LLGATLSFVGVLPPTWPHANLVDIIGDADADRYGRALEVLLGAAEADAILVMNCATAPTSNTRIAEAVLELMQQHRAPERRLKAVFVAWLGDAASQEGASALRMRSPVCYPLRGDQWYHAACTAWEGATRADADASVAASSSMLRPAAPQGGDAHGAGPFPEDCDLAGITAKGRYVLPHPFECCDLVEEA
jgi:hypothetical protein